MNFPKLHPWYHTALTLFPHAELRFGNPEDQYGATHVPAVRGTFGIVYPVVHADYGLSIGARYKRWYQVDLPDLPAFAAAKPRQRARWLQHSVAGARSTVEHTATPTPSPWPAPWTPWEAWGDAQLFTEHGRHFAVVGRGDQLGTVELPGSDHYPRWGFWRWTVPADQLEEFRQVWRAARGLGWASELRRWATATTLPQQRWASTRQRATQPLPKAQGIGVRRRGRATVYAAYKRLIHVPADLPDLTPGMARAYARTQVPQRVRAPWPEPFAARYTDLTCALVWTPDTGFSLREGESPKQTEYRLHDPRWRQTA